MNDLVAAALLGLIQGLTEFLPVSSTAHLALAERVFRLDAARFGLSFDVALHMGTLVAVLIYFARVWLDLVRDLVRGRFELLVLLVIATLPAVVAALLFDELIAGPLRDPRVIAGALVAGSLVFVVAERIGRANARAAPSVADAAMIGIAQALALIPGLSRSGMTISAGLARGIRRDEAARLSFVLATPAVFGAGVKTALDLRRSSAIFDHPDALAVGFVVSFVSGIAAVAFLVRFLRGHSLAWFVPYRLALAGAILAALASGGL
jgi:undecaprenyl-diphosphatase